MNYNELKHFGIPGMKWGVRRYQNEDGTLTKAGKRRYSKNLALRDKLANRARDNSEYSKQARDNVNRGIADVKKYGKTSRRYEEYVDEKVRENIDKAREVRNKARGIDDFDSDFEDRLNESPSDKRRRLQQEAADLAMDLGIEASTRAYYNRKDVAVDTIAKIIRDDSSEAGQYARDARDWARISDNLRNMEVTALNRKEIKKAYRGY